MRKKGLLVTTFLGAALVVTVPALAQVSIGISVGIAPPPLPVYSQPPLPGPDYLWTPGYWAWDTIAEAYYWVPGTWVRAPRPGLLWTPPWWGWSNGVFLFHAGYWGPHVGFYGGVPYGFGYIGVGFRGGYWSGGHLFYNSSVTNVTNVHITNVYRESVVVDRTSRASYNGGPGGVQARANPEEQAAEREDHVAPTGGQQAHAMAAHADPRAYAAANHGRPPTLATPRPLSAGSARAGGGPAPSDRAPLPGAPADRSREASHPRGDSNAPRQADPDGRQTDGGHDRASPAFAAPQTRVDDGQYDARPQEPKRQGQQHESADFAQPPRHPASPQQRAPSPPHPPVRSVQPPRPSPHPQQPHPHPHPPGERHERHP